MDDPLFREPTTRRRRIKNSSNEEEIASLLVELAAARQAKVTAIMLDLYSRELGKRSIEMVKAALRSLCLAKRRDFEPAFPELAAVLEGVDLEERRRNPVKFAPCKKCVNGIICIVRNGERFAGDCECYAAWKQARAAARAR